MKKTAGFTLVELMVAVVIISIVTALVANQITKKPIENARDAVRKTDINAIAKAYDIKAVDKDIYEVLTAKDFGSGKVPTPPEGGSYQGLLTDPQEYFFICAQLEKSVQKDKDLNCLLNSENPNCYCRKSKNAPTPTSTPIPGPTFSPTPSPSGIGTTTPGPSPTFSPTPSPSGIGTSSPGPSPSLTPTPTPTPSGTPVYSGLCPYQAIPQLKPQTVSLEGVDGTWCYDSEGPNKDGNYSRVTPGYCIDNNHNCADFCENNYPGDNVRDGYCSGSWIGFWFNVHCEFGGYECKSWGDACNEGNNMAYCDPNAAPLSPGTPVPQGVAAKRVFKTSTQYNGNLGGLSGADQKCQTRANAANLGGIWKAWLSDGTSSANQRLNHFNGPYTLLDGTVVVDNWTDLTDGTLDRNINMTENKNIDSNFSTVWTDTDIFGNSKGKNCLNWTISFGWPYYGLVGSGNSTLLYWTNGFTDTAFECSSSFLSLYCFEQ